MALLFNCVPRFGGNECAAETVKPLRGYDLFFIKVAWMSSVNTSMRSLKFFVISVNSVFFS